MQADPSAQPTAPAGGLTDLPAIAIAMAVGVGELSAEQVTAAHLQRIAELDPALRALVATDRIADADRALEQARGIDDRRRRGEPVGPLAGVPFVVKDNMDVSRQTTASGSRAHDGVVALHDASAVARMLAADAVLVGRANMDELAMGASTQTSAFGATRNPWDARRSPGGSSGGSAAAVAAGLAVVALGTDTGGSIREPAAQCGLVGIAPSAGLVPMDGVVPFAPDLDRLGPLTRTVADAALVLDVLSDRRLAHRSPALPARVGVVAELTDGQNQAGVRARFAVVLDCLAALGVEVVPVSLPDATAGLTAYMRITSAACVPLLEPYLRTGQAGAEVVRRVTLGRHLLGRGRELLGDAYDVRDRLREQAADAFARCDLLLSPTMPTTAPLLHARTSDEADSSSAEMADPLHAPYTDCWTVVANLAGLPSLSLPIGRSPQDGMPVGAMLTAPAGGDAALLRLAEALETAGVGGSSDVRPGLR